MKFRPIDENTVLLINNTAKSESRGALHQLGCKHIQMRGGLWMRKRGFKIYTADVQEIVDELIENGYGVKDAPCRKEG